MYVYPVQFSPSLYIDRRRDHLSQSVQANSVPERDTSHIFLPILTRKLYWVHRCFGGRGTLGVKYSKRVFIRHTDYSNKYPVGMLQRRWILGMLQWFRAEVVE